MVFIENGRLTDIRMKHLEHVNSMTAGTLPQGMENNSAYNVFDLFTGGSQKTEPSNQFSVYAADDPA